MPGIIGSFFGRFPFFMGRLGLLGDGPFRMGRTVGKPNGEFMDMLEKPPLLTESQTEALFSDHIFSIRWDDLVRYTVLQAHDLSSRTALPYTLFSSQAVFFPEKEVLVLYLLVVTSYPSQCEFTASKVKEYSEFSLRVIAWLEEMEHLYTPNNGPMRSLNVDALRKRLGL